MSFEIGSSYEDTRVLLEVLEGEHRTPKGDRLVTRLIAGGIGLILIVTGISQWGSGDAWLGPAAGIPMLLIMWHFADMRTTVTPTGLTHRGGLGFPRHAAAGDITTVNLELGSPHVLIFRTSTGAKLRVPLQKTMATALGALYPEVLPAEPVQLSRKWAYVAYTLLALAVIGFIALVIIL